MPDLYTLADDYRAAILRADTAAARELTAAFRVAHAAIQAQLAPITAAIRAARAAGEQPSVSLLFQAGRLQVLEVEAQLAVQRFAAVAEGTITSAQQQAVGLGATQAEGLTRAALEGATVQVAWAKLPEPALQALVGFASDGTPLRALLDTLGPQTSVAIREALIAGVATGQGPRQIARTVRDASGMTLTRALTISRTETLRAYRESSRASYQNNSDIIRAWRWLCSLGPRTCPACLALQGREFPLSARLTDHVNGRCTAVPVLRSLPGIAVQRPPPSGEAWLRRQDRATQLAVLGPGKLAAWEAGQIDFAALAVERQSARWGPSWQEATLAEALAASRGAA